MTTTAPETDSVTEPVYEKGSWEHLLQMSVKAERTSESAKILAGKRLRSGAWAAVSDFIETTDDPSGEALYARVKATGLSASTASKIKKVALTARDYPEFGWAEIPEGAPEGTLPKVSDPKMSLDKADKQARLLVDAPAVEEAEDNAADAALAAVAEVAPKSATTVEGGIQVALSKAGDIEEFVKVLIDVLNGPTGEHNESACRAFIRAFAAENAGRVKAAKPVVEKAPAAPKPAPVKKAGPKTAAKNPAPVQTEETGEDSADSDLFDDVLGDDTAEPTTETAPVAPTPAPARAKRATPIRKA